MELNDLMIRLDNAPYDSDIGELSAVFEQVIYDLCDESLVNDLTWFKFENYLKSILKGKKINYTNIVNLLKVDELFIDSHSKDGVFALSVILKKYEYSIFKIKLIKYVNTLPPLAHE